MCPRRRGIFAQTPDNTSMLPSFIVIGAAKCGTTSICNLLGRHPDVFVSDPKEPHYFSRILSYRTGRKRYEQLFEEAERGGFLAVGEGSTSYTHPSRGDFTAARIRETLPDVRLIYMVRHPIRRLESDWLMRRREGRTPERIGAAVERQASLVTFGMYWKHLSLYREHFPDDQIATVFLEDLAEAPEEVVGGLCHHMGVDPARMPAPGDTRSNRAEQYRKDGLMASALRKVPGAVKLRDAMPDSVRRMGKDLLTDEYGETIEWRPGEVEAVLDVLRPDALRLLEHCGKPSDFWDLG
mgnify:CR=1 FL=1